VIVLQLDHADQTMPPSKPIKLRLSSEAKSDELRGDSPGDYSGI
jgi:hypothetical protein